MLVSKHGTVQNYRAALHNFCENGIAKEKRILAVLPILLIIITFFMIIIMTIALH